MFSSEEKRIISNRRARRNIKSHDTIIKILLFCIIAGFIVKWLKDIFNSPVTWVVTTSVVLYFLINWLKYRKKE